MAEKFVDTISFFNKKRNSVTMNISGFAKIFHEQIDEILWKSGQHDIFYSLLYAPPYPGAGQGSTSQWRYLKFIAVSALYICNKFNHVFELFHIGSLDIGTILLCVSSCQMQICANCPPVLWWSVEHIKPFLFAENVRRVPFRHRFVILDDLSSIQKSTLPLVNWWQTSW